MSKKPAMRGKAFDPNKLNSDGLVLWFDDLGTVNEQYRFLSNFYQGEPITIPGVFWQGRYRTTADGPEYERFKDPAERSKYPVEFPTGEHAFQAFKAREIGAGLDFGDVTTAATPGEAKAIGRSIKLRDDWEVIKMDVMAAVVRSKFTPDREEGKRLLDTGDAMLVEGTFWHDRVWGVDLDGASFPGRNWLGTLLMARRAELRALEAVQHRSDWAARAVGEFSTYTAAYNAGFAG